MPPKSVNIEELRCNGFQPRGQQIDLACFEDFQRESEVGKQVHRHNYYMLFLNKKGTGSHWIDFQRFDVAPGMLFLMYPGQIHAWEDIQGLEGNLLFFTDEFFSLRYHHNTLVDFPFFQSTCRQPFIRLSDTELNKLEALLECMAQEFAQQAEDYLKVLRSYLNILLIECNRLYDGIGQKYVSERKGARSLLYNFERLIELHFQELHQVKEYAEKLNITPHYLNHTCKKVTGKSAGQLIRHRIMLEAKRMLLHDTLTVAEIGMHLHFDDNSYFSRFFKKYEGLSPEQFRKKYRPTRQGQSKTDKHKTN